MFRSLKSELSIRRIYHQLEHRGDAHVLDGLLMVSPEEMKRRAAKY